MNKQKRQYPNVGTIGHIDYYDQFNPFTLPQYIYGRKFWFLPVSNYIPQHDTALASIIKYRSEEKQVIILPMKP